MPNRTSKPRVFALAVTALVLVVAALAAYFIANSQSNRRKATAQRFDTRQTTAAAFIEAYVTDVQTRERLLARSLFSRAVSPAEFDAITAHAQFDAAVLLDDKGQLLAVSPASPVLLGKPMTAHYAHLRSAVAGIPAVSNVVASASRREPIVAFAVPFDTPDGQQRVFSGAYAVAATPLQPFTSSALASFRTGRVYLVDSAGTVIATDQAEQVGLSLHDAAAPLAEQLTRHQSGYLGSGQKQQYFVAGPVGGTPWRLVYSLDSTELFETFSLGERLAPWLALALFLIMGLGMNVLFVREILARGHAEDERARLHTILDTAGDAFIGMDATGAVTDWNLAAIRLLGWSREAAIGRAVSTLVISARDRDAHTSGLRNFLDTGTTRLPLHPVMVTAQHQDGHEIPVELTVARSRWQNTWRFYGFVRDSTERLEHERQLKAMALSDALTGLANHRAFLDRLEQAHARARRHDTQLVVLYADIDQFKSINDTFGHTAGDAILREVAGRLREQFRAEDTIGRLGGDEFAVVCEDFIMEPDALAERVRQALAVPYTFRGQPILATASIGYATPRATDTAERLLERADAIMYKAKVDHRH